jgi:hypothetical protein
VALAAVVLVVHRDNLEAKERQVKAIRGVRQTLGQVMAEVAVVAGRLELMEVHLPAEMAVRDKFLV